MGEEISCSHFKHHDFQRFARLLKQETEVLESWSREGRLSRQRSVGGLELEMWIIDRNGTPLPLNERLIAQAASPDIVAELSRFNVEFNVDPQPIGGRGLEKLEQELTETWARCRAAAEVLDASVIAIGTLPTVEEAQLSLDNISAGERYRALNEQAMRLRHGKPFRLTIDGREQLRTEHDNVLLEAAATSLQIHLQVAADEATAYYNASQIASAPLVAVAANSPFLFGKVLWEETRIPVFEQAVDVGGSELRRVSFGTGFANESLMECFWENLIEFPPMLPLAHEDITPKLDHVRLHNGTIWRWNRPLLGFDPDGTPHLRIEQRVPSSGPTVIDMAANIAFYFGLVETLAQRGLVAHRGAEAAPPIDGPTAKANFYEAARRGLEAKLTWEGRPDVPVQQLLREQWIPDAYAGLERLAVDGDLAARLLGIVEARVNAGQQGATWQRRFAEAHGRDMRLLTQEYLTRQVSGQPVHTWDV